MTAYTVTLNINNTITQTIIYAKNRMYAEMIAQLLYGAHFSSVQQLKQ